MNDLLSLVEKLEVLVSEALSAKTEFEKAALLSLGDVVLNDLDTRSQESIPQLDENIERFKSNFRVILGYDVLGLNQDKHYVMALSALSGMRTIIGNCAHAQPGG